MRINSINNFYRTPVISQKNTARGNAQTSNVSFQSSVEDGFYWSEIGPARKYQHLKNPYPQVLEKVYFNEEKAQRVLELIAKYREENKNTVRNINNSNTKINHITTKINELTKEEIELLKQIEQERLAKAIDRLKLARILTEEKRKNKACLELDEKFINLYKLEKKQFPNAIMIMGVDNPDYQTQIVRHLQNQNCDVQLIDFDKVSIDKVNKELSDNAKSAKNSGKHPIIYIKNFDKYTVPSAENFDFISKMKGFLSACSKKFDTTVLVFESNPKRLDENVIGKHRFQRVIDVTKIKEGEISEFLPKYDGYTYVYDIDDNAAVDLYLGNFGYNDKVLWAETVEPEKIRKIIENIGEIKKVARFKDVKYIQTPAEGVEGFNSTYGKTADHKTIYEYEIKK